MKSFTYSMVLAALILTGCGSGRLNLDSDEFVRDVSRVDRESTVTTENAEDILRQYIIDYTIPNPLFGSDGSALRDNPEAVIQCRAVLFDDISTEADILFNCRTDSLSEEASREYRESYQRDRVRDGLFRVLISMESEFSAKSMEPEYWAIYLETPDGVMIEPVDRLATPVTSLEDSTYSERYRRSYSRNTMERDITLYFRKTTFYGKDLLGGDSSHLILVMAREQKTVARVAWKLNSSAQ